MNTKTLAMTLALGLLTIALLPAPASAHTVTYGYDLPSGPSSALGTAVETRLCAEEWDDWDDGVFSDTSDDEDGPLDAADELDDTIGRTVLTPAFTTTCSGVREAWADDGVKVGVFSGGLIPHSAPSRSLSVDDDVFDATYIEVHVGTWDESIVFSGCGTIAFTVPEGFDDPYRIHVYAVHLDSATLETCFGTKGKVVESH